MEDLISRQDAIDALDKRFDAIPMEQTTEILLLRRDLRDLPSATCDDCIWHVCNYNKIDWDAGPKKGRDCTDFVRWLMDEVMDEENWQLNAVANGEIICRKLKKLGLLDVVDGYYVKTQKTGEWEEEDEYGDLWVCDQCGFASEYRDNYCPNCGANMRGEAE